jgi:hypothetical protein
VGHALAFPGFVSVIAKVYKNLAGWDVPPSNILGFLGEWRAAELQKEVGEHFPLLGSPVAVFFRFSPKFTKG